MKKIIAVISLLFVINSISGCGIKGRLYIEEEPQAQTEQDPQTQSEQEEQKHPLILQQESKTTEDDASSSTDNN